MADNDKEPKLKREGQSVGTVYQLYRYIKDKKKRDRKKAGLTAEEKK